MKTDIRTRRRALLASAAAPAIALALMATSAGAQEPAKTFSIAPQPLADALLQLSRQADVDIVASTDLTRGRVAPKVDGQMTTADAMSALLAGSGLVAAPSGNGYVITRASDPQSGSAAGDGADSGTVQALVVTAQKREENIQDVPIAMSAFTQEDLTRSQVAGGPDLMTQVPNFTFTKTNFSGYSIQIRGIGTQAISATTDAAVAVALNNTPFIRNRFFEQEFYDLQRVEVLRGPQGTLYGRNATAGVVNIISAKPKFTYEAKLSADVANYNSTRLEGMINVPLVDDKVALRLAGAWTKRDGYDTNQITGNQIDGRDLWSTRLSLRFEPTDNIHANLIWEHFQEDDDRLRSGKQLCQTHEVTEVAGFPTTHFQTIWDWGLGGKIWTGVQATFSQGCAPASLYAPESFETPNGLSAPYYAPLSELGLPIALWDPYVSRTQSKDLRVVESTVDPKYRAKTDTAELQLQFDLGDKLTLTSETAFNSDKLFSLEDYNRFNTASGAWSQPEEIAYWGGREGALVHGPNGGIFCDPQIGCTDRLVAIDLSTATSRQFSQELRLVSNNDDPFNFSLGANFLRYDTEDKYYIFINSLNLQASMGTNYFPGGAIRSPYVAGVTDNLDCMRTGARTPDPAVVYDVNHCTYMDPNPIDSLNDLGHTYFLSKNPYKLISYAIFGEAYYQLSSDLKLTAGLRWTVDKKEAPRIPSELLVPYTVGYPVAEVVRQQWREPTGRVAIDWKPDLAFTDQTLLYASFSRGYKAGGANPPRYAITSYGLGGNLETAEIAHDQSASHPKTFSPEFVNAYEIGTKNTFLDGKVQVNATGFYYDYKGYQISQIVDRSAVNLNFDAEVEGAELEVDWQPRQNLRLGFKGGYENTRMANGSRAIDLMDRTAGHRGWVVSRPFPLYASNCVLPAWLYLGNNSAGTGVELINLGGKSSGNPGGCELAYVRGYDPVTAGPLDSLGGLTTPWTLYPYRTPGDQLGEFVRQNIDYASWSTNPADYPCWPTGAGAPGSGTEYPGVDPQCLAALSNNGEGFFKDLSGHELPNAPHFTATVTADYTLPLPHDWLMTLHSDFYYQSEAWTRIFNTPGYDKLKAYTNVNLAAIFANEDAGWKIMAYVKNVFDHDSITGAFLNSDDTGLTTNVFLNEPRLYGLRVTKEWTGQGWWTGANPNHPAGEPYPVTVELGGGVQRLDAPYETVTPSFMDAFSDALNPLTPQHRDLDWGDERAVKVTYKPEGSTWNLSAGVRYGRINNGTSRSHAEEVAGPKQCSLPMSGKYATLGRLACDPTYYLDFYGFTLHWYKPDNWQTGTNSSDGSARTREEHLFADFNIGRDVGVGALSLAHSSLSGGLRYAELRSETSVTVSGMPDWTLADGWAFYPVRLHQYKAMLLADRRFKGAGPRLQWDAATTLLGNENTGRLDIDWSVGGAVLFGKQKTTNSGFEDAIYRVGSYFAFPQPIASETNTPVNIRRDKSATVPVLDLSLGLSYDIQRIKLSTGYRWERYFNVLDAGYAEHKSYDRTFDGPYFKVSLGFGG
ncbi:MAG: TonB-dependent receptor domain-containing protein [Ignavibacteriales bacterium]